MENKIYGFEIKYIIKLYESICVFAPPFLVKFEISLFRCCELHEILGSGILRINILPPRFSCFLCTGMKLKFELITKVNLNFTYKDNDRRFISNNLKYSE